MLKRNTTSLTAACRTLFRCKFKCFSLAPNMSWVPTHAMGSPHTLLTNGTVHEARALASNTQVWDKSASNSSVILRFSTRARVPSGG